MTAESYRFFRFYAVAVVSLAAVMGAWTSFQFMLDPRGGLQAPLVPSLLRATAPAASGTALLLALVWWASPLPARRVQADLRLICGRAALASLAGYPLAVIVALVSGLGLAAGFGAQPYAALRGLVPLDLAVGAVGAALDTALSLLLAWRFLARLQGSRLSLPAKLVVVLTVTVPLRASVALIFASLLPG